MLIVMTMVSFGLSIVLVVVAIIVVSAVIVDVVAVAVLTMVACGVHVRR
jgi:hypothetical protein